MAIGPGIFIDMYKDLSYDELNKKLIELKEYLQSDELKKRREREIELEIDDNNCIINVETKIKAIETLIQRKKSNRD